ncbi:unnamed protein product [Phaeothamnion confervicola]
MTNWLASELLTFAAFALGTWRSFKLLKNGDVDFNALKAWCILALLQVFEEYFEFVVAWLPLYYLGKCVLLLLVMLPDSNMATLVFDRCVVPGIDTCHHVLNHMVAPNVATAAATLPWAVLVILWPPLAPCEPSDGFARGSGGNSGSGSGGSGVGGGGSGGSKRRSARSTVAGNGSGDGGGGLGGCDAERTRRSMTPPRRMGATPPRMMPPSPCQVSRLTASANKLHLFSNLHHLRKAPPPTGNDAGGGGDEGGGAAEAQVGEISSGSAAAAVAATGRPGSFRGERPGQAAVAATPAAAETPPDIVLSSPSPARPPSTPATRATVAAAAASGSAGTAAAAAAGQGGIQALSPPVTPLPNTGMFGFPAFGTPGTEAGVGGGSGSRDGGFSGFLRRTLTGDANIRVRDHLFDLKTSSPPLLPDLAPAGFLSPGASPARTMRSANRPPHPKGLPPAELLRIGSADCGDGNGVASGGGDSGSSGKNGSCHEDADAAGGSRDGAHSARRGSGAVGVEAGAPSSSSAPQDIRQAPRSSSRRRRAPETYDGDESGGGGGSGKGSRGGAGVDNGCGSRSAEGMESEARDAYQRHRDLEPSEGRHSTPPPELGRLALAEVSKGLNACGSAGGTGLTREKGSGSFGGASVEKDDGSGGGGGGGSGSGSGGTTGLSPAAKLMAWRQSRKQTHGQLSSDRMAVVAAMTAAEEAEAAAAVATAAPQATRSSKSLSQRLRSETRWGATAKEADRTAAVAGQGSEIRPQSGRAAAQPGVAGQDGGMGRRVLRSNSGRDST